MQLHSIKIVVFTWGPVKVEKYFSKCIAKIKNNTYNENIICQHDLGIFWLNNLL